jgi:hypothetical protein
MIEIDDSVRTPHSSLKFVPANDLAGPLDKAREHPKRLALQLNPATGLPEFSRLKIGLKYSKTYLRDCIAMRRHDVALKLKSSM